VTASAISPTGRPVSSEVEAICVEVAATVSEFCWISPIMPASLARISSQPSSAVWARPSMRLKISTSSWTAGSSGLASIGVVTGWAERVRSP
jgi:hypothetical protein